MAERGKDLIEAVVVGTAAGAGAGASAWFIAANFPTLLALKVTEPASFESPEIALGQLIIAGVTTFAGVLMSKFFGNG